MNASVKVDGKLMPQKLDIGPARTIDDLRNEIEETFNVRGGFTMFYLTEHNYEAVLGSDKDLVELKVEYRNKQNGSLSADVHLEILVKTDKYLTSSAITLKNNTVHETVKCDGCNQQPIRGHRFKSATRENFDLCEGCANSAKYSNEAFIRLPMYNKNMSSSIFSTDTFKQFVDLFKSKI